MDDQFDKKLSSRITEVFDNYEYPPADEGWTELRKKFPVKEERKIAWLWWSSAAAILLVFLGIGLWMNNKPDEATNVATNHPQVKQQPLPDTALTGQQVVAGAKPTTGSETAGGANVPETATTDVNNGKPVTSGAGATVAYKNGLISKERNNGLAGVDHALTPGVKPVTVPYPASGWVNTYNGKPATIAATTLPAQPDTQRTSVNTPAAQQPVLATQVVPKAQDKPASVIAQQPSKTMADLLKEDKPVNKKKETDNKDLKKVNFSVYAATYFNYAEGSANQVNAGAGFTSDIRLGKNIKLSTGVSLAQNTLSYSSLPPVAAGQAFAAAAPAIKTTGFFNNTSSVAEFQKYNASLVGLDIPLNIKYEFNPQKNDTYISAGLSSGTFIDERYTYRYAYTTNGLIDKTPTTQDQTTTSSFSGFYFARTLNVAFGIGYPIGKTNRLIIEPFLKYPLAGMGSQDIHFGAGGVNLKFSFKGTKR